MTTLEERIAYLEEAAAQQEKRIKLLETCISWGLYDIERRFADEVEAICKGDNN